jgi:hypothetical protein
MWEMHHRTTAFTDITSFGSVLENAITSAVNVIGMEAIGTSNSMSRYLILLETCIVNQTL